MCSTRWIDGHKYRVYRERNTTVKTKPKKPNSLLPKDMRRISLLNSDFKGATGLEARLFKKTATHTLSPLQLVAGDDRRIHHGINFARVYKVLEKKGMPRQVLRRLENLYKDNIAVVLCLWL